MPGIPSGTPSASSQPPAPGKNAREWSSLSPFVPPALFLLVYLCLWFAPPVKVEDPWNVGVSLVNASRTTQDPARKQATLDRAGAVLKEVVRNHPYHARAHFFLGYYYDDAGYYDAAIAEAKEAIRLGKGGTFNPVEPIAKDLLVDATLKKAKPLIARKDFAAARTLLEEAHAIHPASKPLLTALGNLASTQQSLEAARDYFEQLAKVDPNDDETWFVLGNIAVAQKQIPAAIAYLEKSVALNPGRAAARSLLSRLKESATEGNRGN